MKILPITTIVELFLNLRLNIEYLCELLIDWVLSKYLPLMMKLYSHKDTCSNVCRVVPCE